MTNQTQEFYESNAHNLMERYDSADMSALHHLFAKHIPPNSKVIDIGFGSGRDLAYLQSHGYDVLSFSLGRRESDISLLFLKGFANNTVKPLKF